IVAIVLPLKACRQRFGIRCKGMYIRLIRRLPIPARQPDSAAVAHCDLDMVRRGPEAIRMVMGDQRCPCHTKAIFEALLERLDDLAFLIKIVSFHPSSWRFLWNRVQDQLEFASRRRNGGTDRFEDVWRRKLVHRNRKPLFGAS